MTETTQATLTDILTANQRSPAKQRWSPRLAAFFVLLGAFASAAVGAALAYSKGRVECVMLDSRPTFRAGGRATVRFLLSNETGRTVKLRPRTCVCGARLDFVRGGCSF